jgi:hypothetical protein
MKKLLMLVVTLMLGASLAMAQGTSGSTDKSAQTTTAPAKKEKAGKKKAAPKKGAKTEKTEKPKAEAK